MRTLFLTAKKFAMDAEESAITLQHIKNATSCLIFLDDKAQELICSYLDISHNLKSRCTSETLEEASRYKKIDYSNEVKEFKTHLENAGYTLSKVVSKVYIKKKNSLATFKEKINKLEESLLSQVFGQENAIEAICDKIVETSYNFSDSTPKGIFLFLGPPATGKTMLSQIISKELDDYDGFKIFDMTQYTSENEGFGLFGLTEGYSEAKEGKLTSYVKKHPRSVIVFDEIEKTATGVLSNFLMMLSSGYVEDGYTQEKVDFTQTILIFTSNLGSELYNNQSFVDQMKTNPQTATTTILDAIAREEKLVSGKMVKALSPEFLSRLSQGQIVLFNKLPFHALESIAKNKILTIDIEFEKEFGIDVEYAEFNTLVSMLLLSMAPNIDVRKLKAKLPLTLFDLITDYIRKSDDIIEKVIFSLSDEATKTLKKEFLSLDDEAKTKFLRTLFRKNETYTYEVKSSIDDGVLNFIFSNIINKKLTRSSDFSGADALVFEVPDISFKDIAGHREAKKRLHEVINILKDPMQLQKFDVSAPKGMLLYGVPGTGKTMLAKAFASEADLPFIQTTGSEILDVELMKSIFKKAKEYAPSIVFIDEIDAIGTRNGGGIDIIINQFLTELNGFSDSVEEQVFVIAATNLKEKIDPAILRSGRIDLHVEIDTLDREARAFFVDKILKKPTQGEFNKEKILTYTAGMTGADLEKVARESSLYVFRNSLETITQEIVIEQINTIKYGTRITHESIEKLLASTAIHEAGHAIISRVLMPEVKIEQITVVPRANALGFVSYDRDTNYSNLTRQDIKNKLCVAFAGREAQLKEYGEEGFDSGASSDLEMATRYALYAIQTLGMGESTGYINISSFDKTNLFEEDIQAELKLWLDEAQTKTKELVQEHWNKVKTLATLLQEKEIVSEVELLEIIQYKES